MSNTTTQTIENPKKESNYGKKNTRFNSKAFRQFENKAFNTKNIPFGYNWLLGYSEKSNIFC